MNDDNPGMISVDENWLDQMMKLVELLNALQERGVDNWEGYADALASVTEASNG